MTINPILMYLLYSLQEARRVVFTIYKEVNEMGCALANNTFNFFHAGLQQVSEVECLEVTLEEDETAYHERETKTGSSISIPNLFTSQDDFDADPYMSAIYLFMSTPGSSTSALSMSSSDNSLLHSKTIFSLFFNQHKKILFLIDLIIKKILTLSLFCPSHLLKNQVLKLIQDSIYYM